MLIRFQHPRPIFMFIQDRIDKILDTVFAEQIYNTESLLGSTDIVGWKDLLRAGNIKNWDRVIPCKTCNISFGIKIFNNFTESPPFRSYVYDMTYYSKDQSISESYKGLIGEIRIFISSTNGKSDNENLGIKFHATQTVALTDSIKKTLQFRKAITSDVEELESEVNFYTKRLTHYLNTKLSL